jgi:hypothetical protein
MLHLNIREDKCTEVRNEAMSLNDSKKEEFCKDCGKDCICMLFLCRHSQ